MSIIRRKPARILTLALLATPAWTGVAAQQAEMAPPGDPITVYGEAPADLTGLAEGPRISGFISERNGNEMQVTSDDGTSTDILVAEATDIKAKGGFLGLDRFEHADTSLINGIPVTVETLQWEGGLVAKRIRFDDDDLELASMIRGATAQRFAQHDVAIEANTAAAEALRGRMADIDQYNIKGTTNVFFDTGEAALSPEARDQLCTAATQAQAMDNALLLVVGYTDATGSQEINQRLSEQRAGQVVNYLQQQCGWAPYRMLTPTGMAEADPLADNETTMGMAQNRRVAVNILVSKAVEEL